MAHPKVPGFICVALLAAVGCASPTTPSTVRSLAIDGTNVLIAIGQTSQFTAIATLWDGNTSNVSAHAAWASSNPTVGVVSVTGLVTVRGFGQTDITATYQDASAKVTVLAIPPPPPGEKGR